MPSEVTAQPSFSISSAHQIGRARRVQCPTKPTAASSAQTKAKTYCDAWRTIRAHHPSPVSSPYLSGTRTATRIAGKTSQGLEAYLESYRAGVAGQMEAGETDLERWREGVSRLAGVRSGSGSGVPGLNLNPNHGFRSSSGPNNVRVHRTS